MQKFSLAILLHLKEIKERFEDLFFNARFYDLTKVGRIRMNRKFGLSTPEDTMVLTKEDLIAQFVIWLDLRERGEGELDDIDHLGNRRVRLVGELFTNQIYLGFLRIERIIRERFRMQEAPWRINATRFSECKTTQCGIA